MSWRSRRPPARDRERRWTIATREGCRASERPTSTPERRVTRKAPSVPTARDDVSVRSRPRPRNLARHPAASRPETCSEAGSDPAPPLKSGRPRVAHTREAPSRTVRARRLPARRTVRAPPRIVLLALFARETHDNPHSTARERRRNRGFPSEGAVVKTRKSSGEKNVRRAARRESALTRPSGVRH